MNPTQRFSSRVENYIKFRPGYPAEVIELLQRECGLSEHSFVADIGSGTGIFSKLLLETGCRVVGVEPNKEMREAGDRLLQSSKNFSSVAGMAEMTNLPDQSVDLITAAQAFHWFDVSKSHSEFLRILEPGGRVVLIWNSRKLSDSTFSKEYEALLRDYSLDYSQVNHQDKINVKMLDEFFHPGSWCKATIDNLQQFDYEGLLGRLLSSSYAPAEQHLNHVPMIRRLHEIFDLNQVNGKVAMTYDTEIYFGHLETRQTVRENL